MGGVSCTKIIKGFDSPIEFFIKNYEIREEFEAVKNYFANFLKQKNNDPIPCKNNKWGDRFFVCQISGY